MSSGSRFGSEYLELEREYEKLGGGVKSRDAVAVADVTSPLLTSMFTRAVAASPGKHKS